MRNPNAKVSDPNDFVSVSGDLYHVEYAPKVMPDGTIELVESGKVDIREKINSYRDQTDMSFILQQLSLGNTDVLTDKMPMYGDFTSVPQTYAEALQLVMDAERQFNDLPLDVRNSFDNDFKQWFAQSGSGDWFDKMAPVLSKSELESEVDLTES